MKVFPKARVRFESILHSCGFAFIFSLDNGSIPRSGLDKKLVITTFGTPPPALELDDCRFGSGFSCVNY